jgi:monoamine oxidase
MHTDILIIGAGAAGLYAAMELSKKEKKVILLEARDRAGGRIHTLNDPSFELPVESGAEFVHGELELTTQLLRKAGIQHYPVTGDLWRAKGGELEKQEDFIEDQDKLIETLKSLEEDMTVKDFLDTYFSGEKYLDLRKSLTSFVEGYDAADASKASCFALLQEMLGEEGQNARVKGGYSKLVDFMVKECLDAGCVIELSSIVSSINWRKGEVTVTTENRRIFTASKAIITLPVSILQLQRGQEDHVDIDPLPAATREAIHAIGNTGVIKVILQFRQPFWKKHARTKNGKPGEISFVFGDTPIPTWWTQLPEDNGMITGWLAGTASLMMKDLKDEDILKEALRSLSEIFLMSIAGIESQLVAHHIRNWIKEPFTRGAYAYEKVTSKHARRVLNIPLEDTLYFAGEAIYEGPQRGTVEGALLSVKEIISGY